MIPSQKLRDALKCIAQFCFLTIAIVPDRFGWAGSHSFLGLGNLFGRFRLLENVGVSAFIVAFERMWCYLSTEVAIDAGIIYIKTTQYVFWIL